MGERTQNVQPEDMGTTLERLAATIHERSTSDASLSYTARLLQDKEDTCLKKLIEEACEVTLACKDNDHDHIRYEMGDVLYHLLVICERYGISTSELAGELVARMKS